MNEVQKNTLEELRDVEKKIYIYMDKKLIYKIWFLSLL